VQCTKKTSEPNDILFSLRAPVGPTNINNIKACIGRGLAAIRCSKEIELKYLLHYLRKNEKRIESLGSGSTFKAITIGTLKELKIPLPPLPQQKKIAAILDAADLYRQKTKALIAKYDELSQSLFLDMFGDPVRNEKGWEKIELQSLAKISSGSTPSRKDESYFTGIIPWVKTGEVNGKLILDTEEKISKEALDNSSCKIYPSGSLIIAMYGQGKTRGQVGMLGIEATTNQACAVIPPSSKMNYLFLITLIKLCYNDLRDLRRGGNQPNLNIGLIKTYKVLFPSLNLQSKFAERFQSIESQKSQAQQSLEKAEELFNSLLQRAFKGELST